MKTISRLGLLIFAGILTACHAPWQASVPAEPVPTDTLTAPIQQETDSAPVWVVVERTLNEESLAPPYVIDARWPNLAGDPATMAPFNAEMDQRVQQVVAEFKESVAISADSAESMPTSTLDIGYDLTLKVDGLVSIYLMIDTYIALSAHPFPSSQALNYDGASGRFLALADLFAPGVDPLPVILAAVEPALQARDLGYADGIPESVLTMREHWNLLPEGLRINFDVYEVGPYVAGPQFVVMPWDEHAPYLNSDGPASIFILVE